MDLNNAVDKARGLAKKAVKHSTLKYKGDVWELLFDPIRWQYDVYDSSKELLFHLNTKSINQAKRWLKNWVDN